MHEDEEEKKEAVLDHVEAVGKHAAIHCAMPGCKQEARNAVTATNEGWYQDPDKKWHCYQHVPGKAFDPWLK